MLVLLDLDGTLTDPFEGVIASVQHALRGLGLNGLPSSQQRAFIGPPLQDSLAALGLDVAQVQRAVDLYRARYSELGLYENRVYDGIPNALEQLAADHLLAVATSKPTSFAELILDHFNLADRFEVIGGATLDGSRRSKADVIAHVLERLGATDALMVGDRAQDISGAKAHGLRSIGVRWGYAEPAELETAGADRIAMTPDDLAECVRALG